MVTLVVATTVDPASIGPASALLSMPGWHPGPSLQGISSFVNKQVRLLKHDKSIVREDHLDRRWEEATDEVVDEVIFLSRHTAISNRPALTVHPIGVPHLREGDVPPAGGKPGWAAPPNPRIGPWLRLLKTIAESHNLTPEFEEHLRIKFKVKAWELSSSSYSPMKSFGLFITQAQKPIPVTCGGEGVRSTYHIGSNSSWARDSISHNVCGNWQYRRILEEAGRCTSHCLSSFFDIFCVFTVIKLVWEGLGLGGGAAVGDWSRNTGQNKVLLGIGGGHYVPRHMDVVLKDGVWVGHLLSGYSLPMDDPGQMKAQEAMQGVGGTWKQAIKVSFETTKEAFPGGEVLAHLDHKSFKSWQRTAIMGFLADEGIQIGKPADFC
ncbi:hypothetical protein DH2020_038134 [Rehmannia glutinosa]|uniref:D-aminoacyl-tRNA deacylase n=1 Tax=Rehmannia glutinosa TaxID=99300 RepID=A0ABR0UZF8_REHGL